MSKRRKRQKPLKLEKSERQYIKSHKVWIAERQLGADQLGHEIDAHLQEIVDHRKHIVMLKTLQKMRSVTVKLAEKDHQKWLKSVSKRK